MRLAAAATWLRSGDIIPLLAGGVLVVAGFLKAHDLAFREVGDGPWFASRAVQSLVIMAELLLGCWLWTGWLATLSRRVAMIAFVAFFELALHTALLGERTCGCLGRLDVSPWLMVGMDAMAVGLLLAWEPSRVEPNAPSLHVLVATAGAALLAIVLISICVWNYWPTSPIQSLRKDSRLSVRIEVYLPQARPEEVVKLLNNATGLRFDGLDASLQLGTLQSRSVRGWALMELLAARSEFPVRWSATDKGYRLVRAAPLGTVFPWVLAGIGVGASLLPRGQAWVRGTGS